MSQFDPWSGGQGGVPPQADSNVPAGGFAPGQPASGTYFPQQPAQPAPGTFFPQQPAQPVPGTYFPQQPAQPVSGSFLPQEPAGAWSGGMQPQDISGSQPPLGYTAFSGPQQTQVPGPEEEEIPAGFGYVAGSDYRPRSYLQWWQVLVMVLAVVTAAVIVVVSVVLPAGNKAPADDGTGGALRNLGLDPSAYALVRAASIDSAYTGDALIVRDEAVYDQDGVTSVSYTAREGQTVYYNTDICKVFAASTSTSAITALQNYRDQIRAYQRDLLDSETNIAGERYQRDSALLENVRLARNIIAGEAGSLANQEDQLTAAISARQAYIRAAYANDQQLSRAYSDLQAQQQSIDAYTRNYKAMETAIVSFYADGYEYGLNLNSYADYTAADVRRMINGAKPPVEVKNKQIIYRTVKDSRWVVLMLADDREWVPVEGQVLLLYLESSSAGENALLATVESHSHTGGELMVTLSLDSGVSNALYTRSTRVTVQDASDALLVPEQAIYIQDGLEGVVINDYGTESFVPVHVLRRDAGGAYVTSVTQGILREGMAVRLFK